jgi:hypothetical protein
MADHGCWLLIKGEKSTLQEKHCSELQTSILLRLSNSLGFSLWRKKQEVSSASI